MPVTFPHFVTHYARGEPFLSVTRAPPEKWGEIAAGFTEGKVRARSRFADPDYLPRRVLVEARLRAEFIAAGGEPRLANPIYCWVGRNARWDQQRTPGMRAYEVPFSVIPSTCVSFTFGDSLLTLDPDNLALVRTLGRYVHPRAGRVYRLEEVRALLPEEPDLAEHLEVQLWMAPGSTIEGIELAVYTG